MTRAQPDTILIVSPFGEERERLAGILRKAGHGVRAASAIEEAVEGYRENAPSCVVADTDLPGGGGAHLVGMLRALDEEAVVILLSSHADVEETVDLMREGAFHIVKKPVQPEQIQVIVSKGLDQQRLSRGNRELKSQLDINEKLAMIGRLASGVAHELNNPLDGVRRYVRLTQEGLEAEESDLYEYLDRAMNGLGRMTSIVRQLLTFSRNVVIENEFENLRTMLEEVVRTLAPSGGAGPSIDLENPYIDVPVQRALFQVFVNLIKNSLDAVEPHGARGLVKVSVQREEENIHVSVSDNGIGVAPDDLRRVFEPFFTTKEVGRGTGLGLPISARIVERCGGTIRIESEQGKGTTVHVTLPVGTGATRPRAAIQGAQQR